MLDLDIYNNYLALVSTKLIMGMATNEEIPACCSG